MRPTITLIISCIFGFVVFLLLESRKEEPCHDHIPGPRCFYGAKLVTENGVAVCRCEEEEPDNP